MNNYRLKLQQDAFAPGTSIEGNVISETSTSQIKSISATLKGDIVYQKSGKIRKIVENRSEIWKLQTLDQLLGLENEIDENQNNQLSKNHPIYVKVPNDIPPSFSNNPVTVRYFLEVIIVDKSGKVENLEEKIVIMPDQTRLVSKSRVLDRNFEFNKGRSIFVNFELDNDIFTSTGIVEAKISVQNRWKRSLKYVHMNIVKKVILLDENEMPSVSKSDSTGVGLPSEKQKIGVGESFRFRPSFNVPALPPTTDIPNLIKIDYTLKLTIGRYHNHIISVLEIPIKIIPTAFSNEQNCAEGGFGYVAPLNNDLAGVLIDIQDKFIA